MLYTAGGAIAGFLVATLLCWVFGVSGRRDRAYTLEFPSSRDILIVGGTVGGACIGFGVGTDRLLSGRYFT